MQFVKMLGLEFTNRQITYKTMSELRLIALLTFFLIIIHSKEVSSRPNSDLLQRQYSLEGNNRNAREISPPCSIDCSGRHTRPVCGSDGNTYPHNCEVRRLRKCEKSNIRIVSKGPCNGTQCSIDCSSSRTRPVCGTDGNTYPHKCEIRRLRKCENSNVNVASKGPCSGLAASARSALRPSASATFSSLSSNVPSSSSSSSTSALSSTLAGSRGQAGANRCLQERQQALEMAGSPTADVYIPKCRSDGSYAKVQCHQATGYCWCATKDGKPIPGSSVKGQKIRCKGTKGSNSRKRRKRPKKRTMAPQGCNPTERSTFNANLISLFTEEYERVPNATRTFHPGAPQDALLDTLEKRVIEWKFSELDVNQDNRLKKREIRSLKKVVKKQVKPKPCARNFDRYCDLDQNNKIARAEWSVCLGVDINKGQQKTTVATETGGDGGLRPDVDEDAVMSHADARPTLFDKQVLTGGSRLSTQEEMETQSEMPVQRNCIQERQAAQEMDQLDPEGRIFIPECIDGGKFRHEQCHSSTGYCWCVDEITGKPIPGTSTHNVMPDCSGTQGRQFKGCPYPLKKRFLTELLDDITVAIGEYTNNATDPSQLPEPNPDHSLEERVVRWKFRIMDRNRNGALERREMKVFKREIRRRKSMRKCSRNFIRYCDGNGDKSIAMEEWVDCMGINDQQRNLPFNPKRRGPNPFSKYLQS